MKAIIWASFLVVITVMLIGCATGSSSSQSSAAAKISGYIDTSVGYHSK